MVENLATEEGAEQPGPKPEEKLTRSGFWFALLFVVAIALSPRMFVYLRPRWRAFNNGGPIPIVRATLAELEVALKAYEADFGSYPPEPSAALVKALSTPSPMGNPYYKFASAQISPSGELLDAWGQPMTYWQHKTPTRNVFRLRSIGPNGEAGGGDDIEIGNMHFCGSFETDR